MNYISYYTKSFCKLAIGLLVCIAPRVLAQDSPPYTAYWKQESDVNIRIYVKDIRQEDYDLIIDRFKDNSEADIELRKQGDSSVISEKISSILVACDSEFRECIFSGNFKPLYTYKLIISKLTNEEREKNIEFEVGCDPIDGTTGSLENGSCIPQGNFFGLHDSRNDPSSLRVENIKSSGQLKVFLNPQYGINADVTFAPKDSNFSIVSSNIDAKFGEFFSFKFPDLSSKNSLYYPFSVSLETGINTSQGFNIVQFKLKPNFTVGIPYTDWLIIKFHNLIGTTRDRFPALLNVSYIYNPTLVNNDLFITTDPVHSIAFELLYNIPIFQNFDFEFKWNLKWDLLREFRLDLPIQNDIDCTFKIYFFGKFDNYIKAEILLRPNASPLDSSTEVRVGLSVALETLLGFVTPP
jgi:hypothetical protein